MSETQQLYLDLLFNLSQAKNKAVDLLDKSGHDLAIRDGLSLIEVAIEEIVTSSTAQGIMNNVQ